MEFFLVFYLLFSLAPWLSWLLTGFFVLIVLRHSWGSQVFTPSMSPTQMIRQLIQTSILTSQTQFIFESARCTVVFNAYQWKYITVIDAWEVRHLKRTQVTPQSKFPCEPLDLNLYMGRPKLDMSDLIDSNVDLAPNGSGGSEAGFQIKGIIAIGAHALSLLYYYVRNFCNLIG